MRRKFILGYGVAAILLITAAGWFFRPLWRNTFVYEPQTGDILFQSLPRNALVDAIEGMTGSRYSHCGIVDRRDGAWVVIEALGTVHATPLGEWMRRGHSAGVAAYRYDLDAVQTARLLTAIQAFDGVPYDIHYAPDDARIYCSELIWKGFHNGLGLDLGIFVRLGDLNWKPYVETITRIEQGPVPLDRPLITPIALTRDPRLRLVFSSFSD